MAKTSSDQRRSNRVPVLMPALLLSPAGMVEATKVLDLSEGGCGVSRSRGELRAGESIRVQPEGLEELDGHVRWASGKRAGIEFDRPLYEPVAAHLQDKYSATCLV